MPKSKLSDVVLVALQEIKCRLESQEELMQEALRHTVPGAERDTIERALLNLRESIRELVEFT